MPRLLANRLSALKIARAMKPGRYADGGGLYLAVGVARPPAQQSKSWVFRYVAGERVWEIGLGGLRDVGLADARELAAALRAKRRAGIDIAAERKAMRERARAERNTTFKSCAEELIKRKRTGWRNEKHAEQWANTLETYAYPVLGKLPVAQIGTDHILRVLNPLWHEKAETAGRVRGRIEAVLNAAAAQGHRSGENPARWRGHLDAILPAKSKVATVRHHAAMPYAAVPGFITLLHDQNGIAAAALEFTILTAARTGEVIGARWAEIDAESGVWTVPAGRMKAAREHRVPLTPRAVEIIEAMRALRTDDSQDAFVFPGAKAGRGLSNMSMDAVLRRMEVAVTVHGFRSSFRDWAADETAFPREVAEACLAHTLKDRTEAAYRRSDLFGKRRGLMGAWAAFCLGRAAVDASQMHNTPHENA